MRKDNYRFSYKKKTMPVHYQSINNISTEKTDIDCRTFQHNRSSDGFVNQEKGRVNYNRQWLQIDSRNYGNQALHRVATMHAAPNN